MHVLIFSLNNICENQILTRCCDLLLKMYLTVKRAETKKPKKKLVQKHHMQEEHRYEA